MAFQVGRFRIKAEFVFIRLPRSLRAGDRLSLRWSLKTVVDPAGSSDQVLLSQVAR